MKSIRTLMFLFALCVLSLSTTPVQALPISGLYNTGVDNSGALLAGGSIDPHYDLISSPGFAYDTAYVVNQVWPISPNGPWMANGPYSKWIAPTANGETNTAGLYTYRTTFSLSGLDPASAVINGQWTTDNNGTDILINLNNTGYVTAVTAFGLGWYPFVIDNGFLSGLNTLDFIVNNASGSSGNPTGLRVEMTGYADPVGDAAAPVPLPSALLLLGPGIVALEYTRRKLSR